MSRTAELTIQRFQQALGVSDRRQAGAPTADQRPRCSVLRHRYFQQRLCQHLWNSVFNQLMSCAMRRTVLFTANRAVAVAARRVGFRPRADYDHLHRIEQELLQRQPITSCIQSEVLHDTGKTVERVFRGFAVFLPSAQCLKPQQG